MEAAIVLIGLSHHTAPVALRERVADMIAALKPVHAKYGPGDRRHVLIHGQFVRRGDQLDALKELQVIASLFPMHTFYWGDRYDKIIGPELAQQISPIKTALKKGLMVTSHTDAPVALPNLMQVMWATVNRTSRSGKAMGADERLTPPEALKAITIWGAYQHYEEASKGSIEPGKLADFVILDMNPLTVDPTTITQVVVLETIKRQRKTQPSRWTNWRRGRGWDRGRSSSSSGVTVMTLRTPLSVLVPQRVRQVPASFAWIEHRLSSEGFLERLEPADIGLYLFLTLAADRHGLSCCRLDRIERALPCFERHTLWDARSRLSDLDLIAYRPWSEHSPDGSYQVLSVPRPKDTAWSDSQHALAGTLRRLQA